MFPRYLLASMFALAVDLGSLYGLMLVFGLGADLAAAGGYLVGVGAHYWASRRFVFAAGWLHRVRWAEFGAFLASGLAGLVLTVAVVHVLADQLGWRVLVAKLVAVGVSFGAVYLIRASWVFRGRS